MRGSVWFDALSYVLDDRLISVSQDKEALSLVNEPFKDYFSMNLLEYAIQSRQPLKRIRFLITVCGARVEN